MSHIIFATIRYSLTMLFGIFVSVDFLDIRLNKKTVIMLSSFAAIDLIVQGLLLLTHNIAVIKAFYPLIAHVPLLMIFVIALKKKVFPSILAITTAYLCCQIANWISLIGMLFSANDMAVDIIYSLVLVITYIIIRGYVVSPFSSVLLKSDKALISFSIVPVFYYIFDYISTVYTELFYIGNMVAVEFPPFLLAVCYVVFCAVYFKQYEEKQEVENRNRLVEIKAQQSAKDIENIKRNEKAISLLRHDMRHFLGSIYDYIENGELEKAQLYIENLVDSIDKTSRKKYCSNGTINTIVSFYGELMKENKVVFNCDIKVSEENHIPDVQMTSILSNGLENAVREVKKLDEKDRVVTLNIIEKSGKLLISLENSFKNKPKFVDGMPVSNRNGHGYGTQSIQYTVEKLNGNCHFSTQGDKFVLQIVL